MEMMLQKMKDNCQRTRRVDLGELFTSRLLEVTESKENKLRREKQEMMEVIIQKDLQIKRLVHENETFVRNLRDTQITLQNFQDKHCTLLWEMSRLRNQRWIMMNQVNSRRHANAGGKYRIRKPACNLMKIEVTKSRKTPSINAENETNETGCACRNDEKERLF